jgi:hypothetical protein
MEGSHAIFFNVVFVSVRVHVPALYVCDQTVAYKSRASLHNC